LKVIYVIDHLRGDGTQRFLTALVKGMAQELDEQIVVSLNHSYDSHVVSRLEEAGAKVVFIGRWALLLGYGLIRLFWIIRRNRPETMVSFLFFSDVIGGLLARLFGVPLTIATLRSSNFHLSQTGHFILRLAYKLSHLVVVNSNSLIEVARERYDVKSDKIVAIPNWVDVDEADLLPRESLLAEIGTNDGIFLFASIGRLDRYKGFDLIIEALSLVDNPVAHLLLIGKGPEEQALRKLAENLGLADRVHFLGYQIDAYRYLGACDCYIQASRFEGLSNATLEAAALGLPIIASQIEGSEELVNLSKNIRLFHSEDVEQLAVLIEGSVQNGGGAGSFGQQESSDCPRKQWTTILRG
jgi:glycosyltransferase involved in cell wall biosynthesis